MITITRNRGSGIWTYHVWVKDKCIADSRTMSEIDKIASAVQAAVKSLTGMELTIRKDWVPGGQRIEQND